MINLDPIQRDLIIEGLEDYIGLWQIAKHVRREFGSLSAERLRELTVRELEPLLSGGLIEAGFPSEGGGFSSWGMDAESTLDRILSEWSRLKSDPTIGDVCWFRNTGKGNALAKAVHRQLHP